MEAPWKLICIVLALVIFAIGGFSRWWANPQAPPYYPTFICAGLFFYVLSLLVH